MSVYDIDGNVINTGGGGKAQTIDVLIASSSASDEIKANADYLCNGSNDQSVIQNAINYVANQGGGVIRLSEGLFYLSSFPSTDSAGDYVALMLPQTQYKYSIEIRGSQLPYGIGTKPHQRGTDIQVSASCYEGLDSSKKYTIIRGGYVNPQRNSAIMLTLTDLHISTPSNQKKITCVDCLYFNRVLIERVHARGYILGYNGFVSGDVPPVAVDGCVGFRSVGGSNSGMFLDFKNVGANGFQTGFAVGGEHFIGWNMAAMYCTYGYTFGDYDFTGGMFHPITLINCCDENNINLPLFKNNSGKQAVNLIDFNMEWGVLDKTPGGSIGDHAKETTAGKFCGNINYTMCYGGDWSANNVTEPFWESGSGHSIQTKNDAQELSGTSALRRTYAPNFMQQYFDTTANKLLICTNPANKTWVDTDGNVVS